MTFPTFSDTPTQTLGPYTEGEIPGTIQITFLDFAGDPIPITGYTIEWRIREANADISTTQVLIGAVADGPGGIGEYTWADGNLDTAGYYYGQMWAYSGTSIRYASEVFSFHVRDAVVTTP